MINLEKQPHWVVGLVLGYGIVILFVVGGIIGDVINSYIWMTIWGEIAEIGGFLGGAGVGMYVLIRGFRKVHVAEEEFLSADALKEIIKERIVGKRLASYVIDIFLVTVSNYVLSFILALLIAGLCGDDPGESFSFLWIICGIMISPIYLTYCFGNGQTLGMSIMNLKLYGVDGRSPIGYKKGFIRWLGMLVLSLVLYLGFLWIVIDENYQGWHDKIAGTYMILSIAQGSEEKDEALAAQEFKEVSQSDKSELDTLAETQVNSEIQGEIVTTKEINETEVDLSGEFSWREASVHEGIITFECPGCKKTHSLKTTLFSSQLPNPAVGLMPTSQEILWGKEIGSMVLAFVVAVTFGVFVAVLVGFHIWIGIVCAVIFMILKPVFTPKFMNKLPVWIFKCNSCGKRTFIASDGTEAAIGELQANVGE